MAKTREIEDLMRAMAEKGYWTEDEQRRVEEIVGKDPRDSYLPTDGSRRRKPFEIEGDWGPENTDISLDASPGTRNHEPVLSPAPEVPPSSLEERVATLERREQLVWKALKDLESRLGVAKEE